MSPNDKSKSANDLPEVPDSFPLSDDPVFNFDLLEPEGTPALEELVSDPPEKGRIKECLCPKCSEAIEIDLSQMPEDGSATQCTACNATIHVVRESCARRSKRQSNQIYCTNCGSRLSQHVHCNACGLIFPDHYILVNQDDARRKARKDFFAQKLVVLRDLKISFTPVFSGKSDEVSTAYTPRRPIDAAGSKPGLFTRRFAAISLGLIAVLGLIVTGMFAYNTHQHKKQYVKNYFRALYGIKTGIDSNLKTCAKMKAEWEAASKSGMRFSPLVSTQNEIMSAKLRGEIDKTVKMASNPPQKLAPAKDKLLALYNVYLESDGLINSRPNSLQGFTTAIDTIGKKTKMASSDFKSNLPESMKRELAVARLKYRGLSDF